jgi:hypothetical protein
MSEAKEKKPSKWDDPNYVPTLGFQYSSITADGIHTGLACEFTSCCGVNLLTGTQHGGGTLVVQLQLATVRNVKGLFGKSDPDYDDYDDDDDLIDTDRRDCSTLITVVIEGRKDTADLHDALTKGGWVKFAGPVHNPNSGNTLTMWSFTFPELVK